MGVRGRHRHRARPPARMSERSEGGDGPEAYRWGWRSAVPARDVLGRCTVSRR